MILCCISITVSSQTLFLKEKDGMVGYVDSAGITKIPVEYRFAYTDTFTCAIAFVAITENGKWKIKAIDRNNKKLFTVLCFDNGPDYVEEGLFRIEDDHTGYMGFADMEGNIVIEPRFVFVRPFHDGLAAFNTGGRFELTDDINKYHAIVGGKWGYIDKQGHEVFPAIFDSAYSFEDKKANVKTGPYSFRIEIKSLFP
jgi:hypothetical protein